MRFLANENFPNPSIRLLRNSGFYVLSIAEVSSGISDKEIVDIAKREQLIILTFDKDYGELIFRYGLVSPPSVVFFRYKTTPSAPGQIIIDLLEKKIKINEIFTVIEKDSVRQRKYK